MALLAIGYRRWVNQQTSIWRFADLLFNLNFPIFVIYNKVKTLRKVAKKSNFRRVLYQFRVAFVSATKGVSRCVSLLIYSLHSSHSPLILPLEGVLISHSFERSVSPYDSSCGVPDEPRGRMGCFGILLIYVV